MGLLGLRCALFGNCLETLTDVVGQESSAREAVEGAR